MILPIFTEVFIIFLLILRAFLHIRNIAINPLPVVCVTNIFPSYHLPCSCVSDFLRVDLCCFVLHMGTSCVYLDRFINYLLFHDLLFCFLA